MKYVLKIATVEDVKEDRELLSKKIEQYMSAHKLTYKIFHYDSGEAFVDALQQEIFDIVFMDIFLTGITGIEAAERLRETSLDCKLIFLTISRDFLEEGYGYNPSHYLLKPIDDAKFEKAMHNCQIKRQLEVPFLDVMSEGIPLSIDTTELIYIDICKRITTLHMKEHVLAVSGSMVQVTRPLLKDERFLQCIQGILVNMDFISEVDGNIFQLKNGDRIPMAIRNKSSLTKQYYAYQFERAKSKQEDWS